MTKKNNSRWLIYLLPLLLVVLLSGILQVTAATTRVECENMTLSGSYAGKITSPFSGVALYANNDACYYTQYFSLGTHNFSIRGASNNSSTARVDLKIGGTTKGSVYFTGTTPSVQTLSNISHGTGNQEVRLTVTTDTGSWDAYVDYIDINDSGSSSTPTPTLRGSNTPTPTQRLIGTPTPTGGTRTLPGGCVVYGTFHCFLLLGQSNMAGYPKAQASDKVEDPHVLVLGYDNNPALGRVTDQWDIACPPLHETYQGAIGPGDWFAKTMIQRKPNDTIGLIPCAISGEKIETFMKVGGSKYSWIINRAKNAQQNGGIIEGILFHQGESNSGDTSWPGKVKQLVTDLRNDLGLGNVPFLAGELLYSGPCAGHNTLVNQLPSQITNCKVISASGLVVDPADTTYRLHFGHDSQVTFGQRYASAMISSLGW